MNRAADSGMVARCADALADAEAGRRPIPPLTEHYPGLALSDAYAIQRRNIERRMKRGERVVGRKVGLTAQAMQELFGVREPDYGHLLDTMMLDEDRRSTSAR